MNQLIFGSAGIPLSTKDRNTIEGIKHVKKLGLGAMELEFVRSVNISKEKAPEVKKTAEREEIILTTHGQYFVNLNAQKKKVLEDSKKRMLDAFRIANECGVWSVCFHTAYYMKQPINVAFENIKKNVKDLVKQIQNEGIKCWFRPETGGKLSQFGDVDELIKLSQEVEQVLPCIDWAHHYARSQGKINSYKDFEIILQKMEKELGKEALQNMHCHCEGIEYRESGEKNHVNLKNSKLNYKDLLKLWKDYKIKGIIISESPNVEEDALLMQKEYKTFSEFRR